MQPDRSRTSTAPAVVVMGVAGCGKTTTGVGLADALGGVFIDADDLHPAVNKAKMASGQALTDDDRWPWLHSVGAVFHTAPAAGTVVACSALRRAYRDLLRSSAGRPLFFVHLAGARELHAARIRARTGHFMPPALLDSQLATLEPLEPDEDGVTVDIAGTPDSIVEAALGALTSMQQ
ncbi:gluconokinase [Rathayibacter sp. Leaf185]|uniref:gluconokinase n=1 Tax=Rathayibacter sp. Leaf185 TaxID=1736292 RepID=UPI000B04EB27|nr:gluconokinase [Rathayibacter sp. Leaf185]